MPLRSGGGAAWSRVATFTGVQAFYRIKWRCPRTMWVEYINSLKFRADIQVRDIYPWECLALESIWSFESGWHRLGGTVKRGQGAWPWALRDFRLERWQQRGQMRRGGQHRNSWRISPLSYDGFGIKTHHCLKLGEIWSGKNRVEKGMNVYWKPGRLINFFKFI